MVCLSSCSICGVSVFSVLDNNLCRDCIEEVSHLATRGEAIGDKIEIKKTVEGKRRQKVQQQLNRQLSATLIESTGVRMDLERFKVSAINYDEWDISPPVETALKDLCKKHNDLIEYLSSHVD